MTNTKFGITMKRNGTSDVNLLVVISKKHLLKLKYKYPEMHSSNNRGRNGHLIGIHYQLPTKDLASFKQAVANATFHTEEDRKHEAMALLSIDQL